MLKKRIIGVITVLNGLAVQSVGYKSYLPIGNPKYLAENLDHWGVDEILLLDIKRSEKKQGPNLQLLNEVSNLGISTPLIYGGGIRTATDAVEAIKNGADRITIDNLITHNIDEIKKVSKIVGAQAVIAAFPLFTKKNKIFQYNYINKNELLLPLDVLEELAKCYVSEFLIIDKKNDGKSGKFDIKLIEFLKDLPLSIIAFGGVGIAHKAEMLLKTEKVSAIAIGNDLNYREHAVQALRSRMKNIKVRKSIFEKTES